MKEKDCMRGLTIIKIGESSAGVIFPKRNLTFEGLQIGEKVNVWIEKHIPKNEEKDTKKEE